MIIDHQREKKPWIQSKETKAVVQVSVSWLDSIHDNRSSKGKEAMDSIKGHESGSTGKCFLASIHDHQKEESRGYIKGNESGIRVTQAVQPRLMCVFLHSKSMHTKNNSHSASTLMPSFGRAAPTSRQNTLYAPCIDACKNQQSYNPSFGRAAHTARQNTLEA